MKELRRDSKEVMVMAMNKVTLKARVQISAIDVKPKYTNIAIQKINFNYKKQDYMLDHAWLQERDYPKGFADKAEEYAWYDIEFTFYQYRDKIDTNEEGRRMYGLTVSKIKKAK